jgi:hypothetical protein
MAADPIYCFPGDSLQRAAELLRKSKGGPIPVVRDGSSLRFMGVIAEGEWLRLIDRNRRTVLRVRDFLSLPPLLCRTGDDLRSYLPAMERFQQARVPVLHPDGSLAGVYVHPGLARSQSGAKAMLLSAAAFAIGALVMFLFEPARPGKPLGPADPQMGLSRGREGQRQGRIRQKRQDVRLTATALGGGLAIYAVRGKGPLAKATAMLGMGMLARGLTHGKGEER